MYFNGNVYKVNSYEKIPCPICHGKLACTGSKKRRVISDNGDRITLSVRRLRCTKCGKIHIELPDLAVPYHLYCLSTIEKVYLGDKDNAPIDDKTYKRLYSWLNGINKYTSPIVSIRFVEYLHTRFAYKKVSDNDNLSPSKEN